jgi:hypothetical protein
MPLHPGDLPIDPNVVDGIELAARLNRILPDIYATSGADAASVTFAPHGSVEATTVQDAIAELDNEKVSKAGDTMTGSLTVNGAVNITGGGAGEAGYATLALNESFKYIGISHYKAGFSFDKWIVRGVMDDSWNLTSVVFDVNPQSNVVQGTTISSLTRKDYVDTQVATRAPASAATAAGTSFAPAGGIVATDVQAALVEVAGKITSGGGGGGTAAGTTFAPAGNIAANNVQAAIVELDSEKLPKSGGGTVSGAVAVINATTSHGVELSGWSDNTAGGVIQPLFSGSPVTGSRILGPTANNGAWNFEGGIISSGAQRTESTAFTTKAYVDGQVNTRAPLTGAGASGTWGINITGSAGSANTANSATTSGSCSGNAATATHATTATGLAGGTDSHQIYSASSVVRGYVWAEDGAGARYGFLNAAGSAALYADQGGNMIAIGNVTAYSDIRLKKDFEVIGGALDKVQQLTGYTFTRIDTEARQTGLIAQDVQKVLPEAVMSEKGMNEGDPDTLSLAYGNMAGLFVEAIKELRAEVIALRAEVAELRST